MYLKIGNKYYCKKSLIFHKNEIIPEYNQEIEEGKYYEITKIGKDTVWINIGQYNKPMNISTNNVVPYPWDFIEHFDSEIETRRKKLKHISDDTI